MKRRVVVTGFGAVSPLGLSAQETWQAILASKSGISLTNRFDTTAFSVKISGTVPTSFNPEQYIEPKEIKRMDLFIQYGIAAACDAITHSGLMESLRQDDLSRVGVIVGSGIGGLRVIEKTSLELHVEKSRISPFFIPSSLINITSGYISIKYGFTGPNHAVATACSTGAHAIGDAARIIKYGDADVMIAGASESAVTQIGVAGFAAAKTLASKYNDNPQKASRPWDIERDGFVISEGAGVLVLEELEHAKKRGAKIYAEISGYGMSGDAYHITSPHPEGRGAKAAMRAALKDASLLAKQIDYINAHGTSTKIGDEIELRAVQEIFAQENPKIMMSSTKSAIGHLLGAAGSVEAILSILAMSDQVAPPTLNLENPEPGVMIDLVPLVAKPAKINAVMTNSFGFGGTNASLVLTKFSQ